MMAIRGLGLLRLGTSELDELRRLMSARRGRVSFSASSSKRRGVGTHDIKPYSALPRDPQSLLIVTRHQLTSSPSEPAHELTASISVLQLSNHLPHSFCYLFVDYAELLVGIAIPHARGGRRARGRQSRGEELATVGEVVRGVSSA